MLTYHQHIIIEWYPKHILPKFICFYSINYFWRSVVELEMYLLGLLGPRALWGSWPVTLKCWPGVCPTDGISIGFGFRSGFGVLWFGVCSADRGAVSHTSRPLHCRGVSKISLWSVGYVSSRSASDFGRISGLDRVLLVGQAPELWNLHMYVNSHDQNIFLFFVLFWISVVRLLYYVMSCWQ